LLFLAFELRWQSLSLTLPATRSLAVFCTLRAQSSSSFVVFDTVTGATGQSLFFTVQLEGWAVRGTDPFECEHPLWCHVSGCCAVPP
jgi:hypothetical protein